MDCSCHWGTGRKTKTDYDFNTLKLNQAKPENKVRVKRTRRSESCWTNWRITCHLCILQTLTFYHFSFVWKVVFTYLIVHIELIYVWYESALPHSIPALHTLFQLTAGCTAGVIVAMEEPGVTLFSFFNPRVATQISGAYLEALWSLDLQSPAHWGFAAVGEPLE